MRQINSFYACRSYWLSAFENEVSLVFSFRQNFEGLNSKKQMVYAEIGIILVGSDIPNSSVGNYNLFQLTSWRLFLWKK